MSNANETVLTDDRIIEIGREHALQPILNLDYRGSYNVMTVTEKADLVQMEKFARGIESAVLATQGAIANAAVLGALPMPRDDVLKIAEQAGFHLLGNFLMAPRAGHITEEIKRLIEMLRVKPSAQPSDTPTTWQPMDTAPKDGTIVRLLVQFEENALEDNTDPQPTIGCNTCEHSEFDEWRFAGWNWQQDCFDQGEGTPIGWMLFAAPQVAQPTSDDRELFESCLSNLEPPRTAERLSNGSYADDYVDTLWTGWAAHVARFGSPQVAQPSAELISDSKLIGLAAESGIFGTIPQVLAFARSVLSATPPTIDQDGVKP